MSAKKQLGENKGVLQYFNQVSKLSPLPSLPLWFLKDMITSWEPTFNSSNKDKHKYYL